MPRHKQVATCRKTYALIARGCGECEHCCLAVCSVCGGAEGTLTTDCPAVIIDHDKQEELLETSLDYTDARGWHLAQDSRRSPRFESIIKATIKSSPTAWPSPPRIDPRVDPRTVVAPSIDWSRVDRTADLGHELTKKAIAWVHAERACDDRAASERRAHADAAHLRGKPLLDDSDRALLAALEREKVEFSLACRRLEVCDEELRQLARRIVDELEERR